MHRRARPLWNSLGEMVHQRGNPPYDDGSRTGGYSFLRSRSLLVRVWICAVGEGIAAPSCNETVRLRLAAGYWDWQIGANMCGFVGFINRSQCTEGEVLAHAAGAMAENPRHRSPDDGGIWVLRILSLR